MFGVLGLVVEHHCQPGDLGSHRCHTTCLVVSGQADEAVEANIVALTIIGIGFWGPLYYTFNKDPPKIVWVIN